MEEEKVDIPEKGEQSSPVCRSSEVRCANCEKLFQEKKDYGEISTGDTASKFSSALKKNLDVGDFLCNSCRRKSYKKKKREFDSDSEEDPAYKPPPCLSKQKPQETFITAQIPRTAKSHKYCLICHRRRNKNPETRLQPVPKEARYQIYERRRIYVSKSSAVCPDHLIGKIFKEDEIDRIKAYCNETVFPISEFVEMREKFGDNFVINME